MRFTLYVAQVEAQVYSSGFPSQLDSGKETKKTTAPFNTVGTYRLVHFHGILLEITFLVQAHLDRLPLKELCCDEWLEYELKEEERLRERDEPDPV